MSAIPKDEFNIRIEDDAPQPMIRTVRFVGGFHGAHLQAIRELEEERGPEDASQPHEIGSDEFDNLFVDTYDGRRVYATVERVNQTPAEG